MSLKYYLKKNELIYAWSIILDLILWKNIYYFQNKIRLKIFCGKKHLFLVFINMTKPMCDVIFIMNMNLELIFLNIY